MLDFLIALTSLEGTAILALAGYSFKTRADALGWKTSYEREKERADSYAEAERDAKMATMIAVKVAEAVGKLPPQKGV